MKEMNTIITIGRQFGSGGKEIAEKLCESLQIPVYDKEMLAVAAKDSGICQELFESHMKNQQTVFYIPLLWIRIPWVILRMRIWICRLIIKFF